MPLHLIAAINQWTSFYLLSFFDYGPPSVFSLVSSRSTCLDGLAAEAVGEQRDKKKEIMLHKESLVIVQNS